MGSDGVAVTLVVPPPAPGVPVTWPASPEGSSSQLPRTGTELLVVLLLAVALLALGAVLVRTGRARVAGPPRP